MDFRYRIFNSDGSEVEQCGNGARCFARFVRDQRLTNKKVIRVQTAKGVIELRVGRAGMVTVDMGVPELNPPAIPFAADRRKDVYTVELGGDTVELSAVSMGNPHGVLLVDDVDTAPVGEFGPRLESHPRFPARANIGFLQIIDRTRVRLRVFERGSGETMACGSGACAAVVAGCLRGLLDSRVDVELKGGRLVIEWQGEGPCYDGRPDGQRFRGSASPAGRPAPKRRKSTRHSDAKSGTNRQNNRHRQPATSRP